MTAALPRRVRAALRRVAEAEHPPWALADDPPVCAVCGRPCAVCARAGLPPQYEVYTGEPLDEQRPAFLKGDDRPVGDALARRVLAELEPFVASPSPEGYSPPGEARRTRRLTGLAKSQTGVERTNRLPGGVRSADEIRAGVPARPRIRRPYRLPD